MKLTFLGTGTSQGVPVIGCRCKVCTSTDRRDQRLRTAAMVETCGLRIVIDAGPDFRYQMLRTGVRHIDAILLTHEHKDHIGGLDDVRAFNFVDYPTIHKVNIYANARTIACVRKDFDYAFAADKYRGVPEIELHKINIQVPFFIRKPAAAKCDSAGVEQKENPQRSVCETTPTQSIACPEVEVIPIAAHHSPRFEVVGYRIGRLAYLTDVKAIDEVEFTKLQGLDVLVVNALRHVPHDSHLSLGEALELIARIAPRKAYLTHMSHEIGLHALSEPALPQGVQMAYDTLQIEIPE